MPGESAPGRGFHGDLVEIVVENHTVIVDRRNGEYSIL